MRGIDALIPRNSLSRCRLFVRGQECRFRRDQAVLLEDAVHLIQGALACAVYLGRRTDGLSPNVRKEAFPELDFDDAALVPWTRAFAGRNVRRAEAWEL
jgi:hypothetical protein